MEFLDVSNFNTLSVLDIECMFLDCESLISLDLTSFDTSHVIYKNSMLFQCISINSLDLANFNTSAVTDMSYMFSMLDEGIFLPNIDINIP